MFMTLGEAAKQSKLSKATISRAIRDGKLSAIKSLETNSFKIDPSELHRYTEAMQVIRNTVAKQKAEQAAPPTSAETDPDETPRATILREARERADLEARVRVAEERLAELKADLKAQLEEMRRAHSDTRAERDKWQQQAQHLMLTHQPQRRSLLDWFKRAG